MTKIAILEWGGKSCPVVFNGAQHLTDMCLRLGRIANVSCKGVLPLSSVKNDKLRKGWDRAALEHGCVFATGFTAVKF